MKVKRPNSDQVASRFLNHTFELTSLNFVIFVVVSKAYMGQLLNTFLILIFTLLFNSSKRIVKNRFFKSLDRLIEYQF